MNKDPYSDRISNTHWSDRWTCPACCHELGNVGEGTHTCPKCKSKVECRLDYIPECVASLVQDEETAQ